MFPRVKVQNSPNPELMIINNAYKYQQFQNLNGQLSLDKLKSYQRSL